VAGQQLPAAKGPLRAGQLELSPALSACCLPACLQVGVEVYSAMNAAIGG
jgi:hypothetical protein